MFRTQHPSVLGRRTQHGPKSQMLRHFKNTQKKRGLVLNTDSLALVNPCTPMPSSSTRGLDTMHHAPKCARFQARSSTDLLCGCMMLPTTRAPGNAQHPGLKEKMKPDAV